VITVPVSAAALTDRVGIGAPLVSVVAPLANLIAPLRSVNAYGLFAVMTTTRPEIIVEGSNDGVEWKAYEFAHKPGDPRRRPPWVAPHQPRPDWQMWFAAPGRYDDEPWFESFCQRLLAASPDVLRLLASDPLGGRPPRLVRATRYRYRFSDWTTRRSEGMWWRRERLGGYSPMQSRRWSQFHIEVARPFQGRARGAERPALWTSEIASRAARASTASPENRS